MDKDIQNLKTGQVIACQSAWKKLCDCNSYVRENLRVL